MCFQINSNNYELVTFGWLDICGRKIVCVLYENYLVTKYSLELVEFVLTNGSVVGLRGWYQDRT